MIRWRFVLVSVWIIVRWSLISGESTSNLEFVAITSRSHIARSWRSKSRNCCPFYVGPSSAPLLRCLWSSAFITLLSFATPKHWKFIPKSMAASDDGGPSDNLWGRLRVIKHALQDGSGCHVRGDVLPTSGKGISHYIWNYLNLFIITFLFQPLTSTESGSATSTATTPVTTSAPSDQLHVPSFPISASTAAASAIDPPPDMLQQLYLGSSAEIPTNLEGKYHGNYFSI